VIGLGAAIENFIPPVPADTFVLLGAFLAESGRANAYIVFAVTWSCNVLAAVVVYELAHRHGEKFFQTRFGHWLLHPKQMEQIGVFYDRWGVPAIFVSRFLPAFRALVPVFAGVTRKPLAKVLPPLAIASALWYGALCYLGVLASRNWERIVAFSSRASAVLLVVALVVVAGVAVWWWRSRKKARA